MVRVLHKIPSQERLLHRVQQLHAPIAVENRLHPMECRVIRLPLAAVGGNAELLQQAVPMMLSTREMRKYTYCTMSAV